MKKVKGWREKWTTFAEHQAQGSHWISISANDFYPDYLPGAVLRYQGAVARFGVLAADAPSSSELLRTIYAEPTADRLNMLRIFRRYVSPASPVELLKRMNNIEKTITDFANLFRPIVDVRAAFLSRPAKDEALSAILREHQERGKPGVELTRGFFDWIKMNMAGVSIRGGRDIPLTKIFPEYLNKTRGVDFIIETEDCGLLAVGYIHYDSDRGGAQEGDRTGGYADAAEEIGSYLNRIGSPAKIIFVNDGPGLLAGAMWRKYSDLEVKWPKKILVTTLKMLPKRLNVDWLRS